MSQNHMFVQARIILLFVIQLGFSQIFSQSYYAIDFIENKGQWDGDFKFKSVIGDGAIFLNPQGYTVLKNHPDDYKNLGNRFHGFSKSLAISAPVKIFSEQEDQPEVAMPSSEITIRKHAYRVKFSGSNSNAIFSPERPTGEVSNYFLGNDPLRWKSEVNSYGAIVAKGIYPGIDIKYYSIGEKLKYDLIVQPGSKLTSVVIQYEGIDKLAIKKGQLIISTSVGEVKEMEPYAYQIIDGQKKEIGCRYELLDANRVHFKVSSYDPSAVLIIDPELIFSTYSGSRSDNFGYTAAPGFDGSLYAGGIVFGVNYPRTEGAFQDTFFGGGNSNIDIGLTRISPTGNRRIFSTYLGGRGDDFPHSIYVDPAGNPVILGRTGSLDFPRKTKLGPGGNTDIFITKLSADGKSLIGGMLIGGSDVDGANIEASLSGNPQSLYYNYGDNSRSEVILDQFNNVYVAASSRSRDFPTLNASQTQLGGGQDGVVLKLNPDLSSVLYSTYLGGADNDAAFALAINPINADLYVAGATASNNFPGQKAAIGSSFKGVIDGFVQVYKSDGTVLNSAYLSTPQLDILYGIQFDAKGFPYIMGISLGDWPIVNANFKRPGSKQFIAKLNPDLSGFVYSTVYGRAASLPNISPVAFLVDRCENVYVSGWGGPLDKCYPQSAWNYRTSGTAGMETKGSPIIQSYTDNSDFYLFVMKRDATDIEYGSFFGQFGGEGEHVDGGTSRFDRKGAIYQAICANCGGRRLQTCNPVTRDMITAPRGGVIAQVNGAIGSGNGCNLAAFKISFGFDGVEAGPQAKINGVVNDTSGCVPLTVDFTDSLEIGKEYRWDFDGDGIDDYTGDDPNQSYTYTQVGLYRVRLTAIDNEKCIQSDIKYINIKVGSDEALLSVLTQKVPPCESLTFKFLNNSTPPPGKPFSTTSFIWDFGDGSPITKTGKVDFEHSFPAVGSYKVRLTLNDDSYCNAYDFKEFNIYVSPNVEAKFTTPKIGCLPYSAEFINTSVAGVSFSWDFGDNSPIYNGPNPPPHLYTTQDNFVVKLTVTDPNTCNVSDTYTFTISTKPSPVANFTFLPDPPQENVAVRFTNLSTGATSYFWDFGDGDTSKLENPSHYYRRTDVFNAYLIAFNDFGCSDTAYAEVASLIKPLVDVPNAFTPNGDGRNDNIFVRGYGIEKMTFTIYNRFGQEVFISRSQDYGWDGRDKKGVLQPMDAYAYTLVVQFGDGSVATKKGDITLIR